MSLKSTKAHLVELIADTQNRVIALTGKWGTGKSHLWHEVKNASEDDVVKNALYASLFGLSDMNQIKLKILQSALPHAEATPRLWETASKGVAAIKKGLESFHKGFSTLSDLALLVVPTILTNKVIVIDDIERKHDKLSIDEVMGFIDEYTQQHKARIILILNDDQLFDRSIWDKLREKVIDQEIRLDTSPAEAFEIAQNLSPSPYADRIMSTVETCGLTNIRVIRKVIRVVNRILRSRTDLSNEVLARVIPSTVLLSAIHYKGIDDGPDFDFVLNIGSYTSEWDKKEDELDEEGKRRARWRLLVHELNIITCDEYEHLVIEFLKSGLFDGADLAHIIERYNSETETMNTQHMAHQLYDHVFWHHAMTEEQLLQEARGLINKSHLLDAYNVTSLHDLILELSGGAEVANLMIDHWIQAFQARVDDDFEDEDFWHRPVHPRIKATFVSAKASAQANTTVFDACYHIAKHGGWGHKQESAMKSASVMDFEATIKSLEPADLRLFMCRLLEMCVQRQNYEKHFGTAVDHFIQACSNICKDPDSGRLAGLITRLFKDAKLEFHLDPEIAKAESQPSSSFINSSEREGLHGEPR